MTDTPVKIFFLTALALTGILCGASLDQSIKQLPSRHLLGIKAFSEYAKAADLKNGVAWYALLGIGAALTTIGTAILILISQPGEDFAFPIYFAGCCSICHLFCTSQAIPTYRKQKRTESEDKLKRLFNKFERIQITSSIFIVLTLLSLMWSLTILMMR